MAKTSSTIATAAEAATKQADAPQVILEHTTLQGQKLRVVIKHAPGIDYFVDVETLKGDQWVPIKRGLKELLSPAHSAIEVAVLQLAQQLAAAKEQIAALQTTA